MLALKEKLGGLAERIGIRRNPDVTGNVDALRYSVFTPRLDLPQLPIDEEITQKMEEAAERGLKIQVAITFNLPDCLVEVAKRGCVKLWYLPKAIDWPFFVGDKKNVFWISPSGKGNEAWFIGDSLFKARWFQREFNNLTKVRILPEEAEELKGLIEACRKIIEGSSPEDVLDNLDNKKLHPVDIFWGFAERRGVPRR